MIANETFWFAIGFPEASLSATTSGAGSARFVVPVWLLPATTASVGGCAISWNVTGELATAPLAVAVTVLGPVAEPRKSVVCAWPLPFVTTWVVVRLPPPDATAKVTGTPATGFPAASATATTSACARSVPGVAAWPSPETIVSLGPVPESVVPRAGSCIAAVVLPFASAPLGSKARSAVAVMPSKLAVSVSAPWPVPWTRPVESIVATPCTESV